LPQSAEIVEKSTKTAKNNENSKSPFVGLFSWKIMSLLHFLQSLLEVFQRG